MSTVALPEPARSRPGRLLRTLSDERLVARIRSGDEAAFEVVYDRYQRDLLSFCRHMLGSREEAEDALQHVCISAYSALQRDDRPIQLKAWLFAIARNRCLSMLRARREHADVDDVQPSVEGLASEVQRREDLREMLADLQRLPEDQRAALVLSELGAHSHEEVAMILDVRKEKVKALVFQARERLIGARRARDTDCAVIREQLATLRGGALRRTELRRHVDACPGCAEFKQEVQRQRAAMAVMLPVIPGAALKGSVLSAVFAGAAGGSGSAAVAGGAGAALVGGGGMFAGLGAQGLAVKALAVLAVAGGAGGTGYVAVEELRADPAPPVTVAPAVAPAAPPTTSGARPASGPASTSADPNSVTATGKAKGRARRGAGAPGRSGVGASGNGAAANGTGSAASAAAGGNAGGSATAKAEGRGKPSGAGATRRSSKATTGTTKKSTSRSRRSAKPRRTTAVKAEPKAKRTTPATAPKSSKPAESPGKPAKDPKSSSAPAASDQTAGPGPGQGSGAGAGNGGKADPAGGTPAP